MTDLHFNSQGKMDLQALSSRNCGEHALILLQLAGSGYDNYFYYSTVIKAMHGSQVAVWSYKNPCDHSSRVPSIATLF